MLDGTAAVDSCRNIFPVVFSYGTPGISIPKNMDNTMQETSPKFTYRDYCSIPDDGKQHEIIDGDHYVNPAPGTYHQTVSRKIQFQLFAQIELPERGFVYNAPTDLQLSEHDIVQPDIVVVLAKNKSIITPTKIKGVPDLVIEILSPSTVKNDRERKFSLYQRCEVPEYWLVDPEEHVISQFVLQAKAYHQLSSASNEIRPHFIEDAIVDLRQVW